MAIKKAGESVSYDELMRQVEALFHDQDQGQGSPSDTPDEQGVNLPQLARDLVTSNLKQFGGLFSPEARRMRFKRTVSSREELRELVASCLIPEYQIPHIIDAVTDYLYEISAV